MQIRYYLGLAIFLLGILTTLAGNSVDEGSWLYIGMFLCVFGMVIVMTSRGKDKTGSRSRASTASAPSQAGRASRHSRRLTKANSGGSDKDHDDGGGGDGD